MNNNILVTFGIAAYNVEAYISQCIKSALVQVGTDLEIIIVDDGSTDKTGEICDKYAKTDDRLRVIHTENNGVSAARNRVIDEAGGRFIFFIDGDDMITTGCTDAIRNYKKDAADIICFDLSYFRYDDRLPVYSIQAPDLDISGESLSDAAAFIIYNTPELKQKYINNTILSSCGKIYRTSFLRENKLYFDTLLKKSQDQEFNFRCVMVSNALKLVRRGVYLYRNNPNSVTKRYNPNICSYTEALITAIKRDIQLCPVDLRERFTEQLDCLIVDILITDFTLDIFHENNPYTRSERIQKFNTLLLTDKYKNAVISCPDRLLKPIDLRFKNMMVKMDFNGFDKYFRSVRRSDRYRAFLNRLGITRIYKKLLRRN